MKIHLERTIVKRCVDCPNNEKGFIRNEEGYTIAILYRCKSLPKILTGDDHLYLDNIVVWKDGQKVDRPANPLIKENEFPYNCPLMDYVV